MKKAVFLLAAALLLAAPAKADDEKFTRMDADKDKAVSWEEFHQAYPGMQRHAFDAIDTNKDGKISPEEWAAFRKTHSMGGQGMGGMGGQGMGGGKMMPPPAHNPSEGGAKPLITPPVTK